MLIILQWKWKKNEKREGLAIFQVGGFMAKRQEKAQNSPYGGMRVMRYDNQEIRLIQKTTVENSFLNLDMKEFLEPTYLLI